MLVTITSDASYDQYSNSAGYGFLISSNVGRFSKSGKLDTAHNITEAELMAIANSLYYVCHHKDLWGTTKIILNVDCIYTKDMIFKKGGTTCMNRKKRRSKKLRESSKRYRKIVNVIRRTIKQLKLNGCLTVELRHVKSHSKVKDTRSKANKYVDKLAVKARKQ